MAIQTEKKWTLEEWPIPEPLPLVQYTDGAGRVVGPPICLEVGIPFPSELDITFKPHERILKDVWFHGDAQSWYIPPFRRREIWRQIKRSYLEWYDWLVHDSTPTFIRDIKMRLEEKDGIAFGVGGPKGSGKSTLNSMLLHLILDITFKPHERILEYDGIPHILFRYRDLAPHLEKIESLKIGCQVDEDLVSTGELSRNLVVHVNNAFETARKAELTIGCTGVNLNFEGWGDSLDLRLVPWGYNKRFQATRAVVLSKKSDVLGLVAVQRLYRPEDLVIYKNSVGTHGEYKARATAYSIEILKEGGVTGAIDDVSQTLHIEAFKDWLQNNYLEKEKEIPNKKKCRRLYRKAKLPAKSYGYMDEIIEWAIDELDEDPELKPAFIPTPTEGWNGLRSEIYKWITRQKIRKRTAHYLADWYIYKGLDQGRIGAQYGVGRDAVNAAIRRYADIFDGHESEVGMITERWFGLHTESLGARVGRGGKNDPDVLLQIPGRTKDLEVAVNVKLCLESKYRRQYTTTPEDKWTTAILAVVHARVPVIRLYWILGPSTYAHWEKGVPCAPENLEDKIREMVRDV